VTRIEEVKDRIGVIVKRVTPEQVAATREVNVEKLRRRLAGDIDNIVLMAIQRERSAATPRWSSSPRTSGVTWMVCR
jgi:hypothetical protein